MLKKFISVALLVILNLILCIAVHADGENIKILNEFGIGNGIAGGFVLENNNVVMYGSSNEYEEESTKLKTEKPIIHFISKDGEILESIDFSDDKKVRAKFISVTKQEHDEIIVIGNAYEDYDGKTYTKPNGFVSKISSSGEVLWYGKINEDDSLSIKDICFINDKEVILTCEKGDDYSNNDLLISINLNNSAYKTVKTFDESHRINFLHSIDNRFIFLSQNMIHENGKYFYRTNIEVINKTQYDKNEVIYTLPSNYYYTKMELLNDKEIILFLHEVETNRDFIKKIDLNGKELFEADVSSNYKNQPNLLRFSNDLAVNYDGSSFLVFSEFEYEYPNGKDFDEDYIYSVLHCFNQNGEIKWELPLKTGISKVIKTNDDCFLIAGYKVIPYEFNSEEDSAFISKISKGAVIIKVNQDGNVIWSEKIGETGDFYEIEDLFKGESNNYWIAYGFGYNIVKIKDNTYSTVSILINNEKVVFDVPPIIKNGRTLLPLRKVFETLGASIEWNEVEKSVVAKKGDIVLKLTLDSDIAYVNNKEVKLDVPATLMNGRTLVPLRFVSEALGAELDFHSENYEVKIKLPV